MASRPEVIARQVLGERPGAAAVALWHDEQPFYAELVRADVGEGARLQLEAKSQLFEIGSLSKVFTGVLLAQAVERGDLALDDRLGELLSRLLPVPQAKALKLSPNVAAVTLRQLVTHTSCLPRLPANFNDVGAANPYEHYTRAMMFAALSTQTLAAPAPCPASYSNFGFAVLGELLSLRYDRSWESLVAERIAKPLGLRDTSQHQFPGGGTPPLAPPFSGDRRVSQWDFDAFAGAGGLRSTKADMLVFGRALMAGQAGPLGDAAERVLRPLADMNGGQIGYALMMRGPAERRTYFHDGGTGGFRTYLLMLPDVAQAAVVMVSNADANAGALGAEVLAARYTISDTRMALDPAALPEYVGVFRVDPKMAFTFVVQDKKLYGRLTGQGYAAMTPAAPDVFTLPQFGAEFTFGRENGKVVTMTLRQQGGALHARRTPEPAPALAFGNNITAEIYAGRYVSGGDGSPILDFDVGVNGGQMSARVNQQPWLPVFPVPGKPDCYAWDVEAAELQFERDAGGTATALVLHEDGQTTRAKRMAPGAGATAK